ncbi:hypothetical protein SGI37_20075, partial [Providencia rettgeri]
FFDTREGGLAKKCFAFFLCINKKKIDYKIYISNIMYIMSYLIVNIIIIVELGNIQDFSNLRLIICFLPTPRRLLLSYQIINIFEPPRFPNELKNLSP